MPVINRIADFHADMTQWRRDFHQHPELGLEEHRTADRVATLLRQFGVDEVHTGIAKNARRDARLRP
jgi:hippurate hydrolase